VSPIRQGKIKCAGVPVYKYTKIKGKRYILIITTNKLIPGVRSVWPAGAASMTRRLWFPGSRGLGRHPVNYSRG
jgi:hypothetical protein